jgi:hypothetical protein
MDGTAFWGTGGSGTMGGKWNGATANGWYSASGLSYVFPGQTVANNGLSPSNTLGASPYTLIISITNWGSDVAVSYLVYSTQTNAQGNCVYVDGPFTYIDYGGAAQQLLQTNALAGMPGTISFDAVGFFCGTAGTSANEFDFEEVQLEYVPEPVSMALVGFGILTGGLFIRRRKS